MADPRALSARADQAEADLDLGILDQLLRTAEVSSPAAGTEPPTSSFAAGARLLEVVGEQQATALTALPRRRV